MLNILPWIVFFMIITVLLFIDLFIFHKKTHRVTIREAVIWTLVWIAVALLFNLGVYFYMGPGPALNFLTGYLLEKSLSVDNIFVFILIFSFFKTPEEYQHKILFWGIIGAVLMRGLFIAAGVTLMNAFHIMIYIFGVVLILTAVRMFMSHDRKIQPEKNPVIRFFKRVFQVTDPAPDRMFFIKKGGRFFITTSFIVLLVIETTDVVFAVDSIPAILAITTDPFIVFTSNIFAILGLRALFFAIAGIMRMFKYLSYGLSLILGFIGVKMLLTDIYEIPTGAALVTVAMILILSILLSVLIKDRKNNKRS